LRWAVAVGSLALTGESAMLCVFAPADFSLEFSDRAVDRRRQRTAIVTSKQRCPREAQSVGRAVGDGDH